MNTKQLISAGFAITAFAAASIPAVGGALLPDYVDRPAVAPWTGGLLADASALPVVMRSDVPSTRSHTIQD